MKARTGRTDKANCLPVSRSGKFVRMQFETCAVQPHVLIRFRTHVKETFMGENISDCSDGSIVTTIGFRISERIPKYPSSEENFRETGKSAGKEFPGVYSSH